MKRGRKEQEKKRANVRRNDFDPIFAGEVRVLVIPVSREASVYV
jgi:hypothetical protein